jgi:hypothetical protein
MNMDMDEKNDFDPQKAHAWQELSEKLWDIALRHESDKGGIACSWFDLRAKNMSVLMMTNGSDGMPLSTLISVLGVSRSQKEFLGAILGPDPKDRLKGARIIRGPVTLLVDGGKVLAETVPQEISDVKWKFLVLIATALIGGIIAINKPPVKHGHESAGGPPTKKKSNEPKRVVPEIEKAKNSRNALYESALFGGEFEELAERFGLSRSRAEMQRDILLFSEPGEAVGPFVMTDFQRRLYAIILQLRPDEAERIRKNFAN